MDLGLTTVLTVNATNSSSVPLSTFNSFSLAQYNLLSRTLNGPSNPLSSSNSPNSIVKAIIALLAIILIGSVIYGVTLMTKHHKAGIANAQAFSTTRPGSYSNVYNPQTIYQPTTFQPYNPYSSNVPQMPAQQSQPNQYASTTNLEAGIASQYPGNMIPKQQNPSLPNADWYPDPEAPSGSNRMRYWDGTNWTEHYHDPDAT